LKYRIPLFACRVGVAFGVVLVIIGVISYTPDMFFPLQKPSTPFYRIYDVREGVKMI
jgi:hypothetical protein